jgi:hypothetical protein
VEGKFLRWSPTAAATPLPISPVRVCPRPPILQQSATVSRIFIREVLHRFTVKKEQRPQQKKFLFHEPHVFNTISRTPTKPSHQVVFGVIKFLSIVVLQIQFKTLV